MANEAGWRSRLPHTVDISAWIGHPEAHRRSRRACPRALLLQPAARIIAKHPQVAERLVAVIFAASRLAQQSVAIPLCRLSTVLQCAKRGGYLNRHFL